MENLLTLKQIAEQLGIPESNLRYYRARIEAFLPSEGAGRRRRYYPDSVAVFRRALAFVQEGMTLDGVCQRLGEELPLAHEQLIPIGVQTKNVANETGGVLHKSTADLRELQELTDLKQTIGEMREKIRILEDACEELTSSLQEKEEALKTLNGKVGELQTLLDEKSVILDGQCAKLLSAQSDKMRLLNKIEELEDQLFGALQDKSEMERNVLKELQGLRQAREK